MLKFYKGNEHEITNTVELFNGFYHEYIDTDGEVRYMPVEYFSDTKEESLEKWKPYGLDDINKYHKVKFGKQDELTQVKKLYEEVVELFHELEHYFENPDNIDKIKDEFGDVIQSGAGLFSIRSVAIENFKKLAKRIYPDNFKHKEEK